MSNAKKVTLSPTLLEGTAIEACPDCSIHPILQNENEFAISWVEVGVVDDRSHNFTNPSLPWLKIRMQGITILFFQISTKAARLLHHYLFYGHLRNSLSPFSLKFSMILCPRHRPCYRQLCLKIYPAKRRSGSAWENCKHVIEELCPLNVDIGSGALDFLVPSLSCSMKFLFADCQAWQIGFKIQKIFISNEQYTL
jgi:hypothetical protein